jgi:hypothetical protein
MVADQNSPETKLKKGSNMEESQERIDFDLSMGQSMGQSSIGHGAGLKLMNKHLGHEDSGAYLESKDFDVSASNYDASIGSAFATQQSKQPKKPQPPPA